MYKNKSEHGLNNICGQKIRKLRLEMKNVSQRKLADMLQVCLLYTSDAADDS